MRTRLRIRLGGQGRYCEGQPTHAITSRPSGSSSSSSGSGSGSGSGTGRVILFSASAHRRHRRCRS